MEVSRKKLAKLLPIFALASLIATASAAVYNIMYLQGEEIAVETPKVYFVDGNDATPAGAAIGTNGTYVKFTSLGGWPNATRFYTQAVNITNADSGDRTFSIEFDSWTGDTDQVSSMLVKVYDDAGSQQGSSVTLGSAGSSTGDITIGSDKEFSVRIELLWNAGARTVHNVWVTLKMTVNNE